MINEHGVEDSSPAERVNITACSTALTEELLSYIYIDEQAGEEESHRKINSHRENIKSILSELIIRSFSGLSPIPPRPFVNNHHQPSHIPRVYLPQRHLV